MVGLAGRVRTGDEVTGVECRGRNGMDRRGRIGSDWLGRSGTVGVGKECIG